MSDAELNLAQELRWLKLEAPEREYRFHDTRRWRFDFAWPAHKLAVEVEGGGYSQGRHTRGDGFEKDMEKYNEAITAGWAVLRVTPDQVRDGRAIMWIEQMLKKGDMS